MKLEFKNIVIAALGVSMLTILYFGHSGFSYILSPEIKAAEVAPGSGYVVYSDGTEISQAPFITSATDDASFSALASVTVGTMNPFWVKTAASPVKKQAFMGNLDGSGKLELLSWTGTNWILDWTENKVGSAALDTRAYDMEFERNSGEAIAVWAKQKGTTGGTLANDFEYRVWNELSWGASTSFANTITVASVSWVELWSHPASGSSQNDITMCYAAGNDPASVGDGTIVGCAVWNGDTNTWGNQKLVESNAEESGAVADSRGFSGFYEQGSGDFVAVAGTEGSANIVLTTWNGSSWTATAAYSFLDATTDLSCSPMPWINGVTNNQAVCGNNSDSADDFDVTDWNGSAFGTATSVDTATSTTSGAKRIAVESAWLINGTNRVGLIPWTDAAATAGKMHRWDEGAGTWAAQDAASASAEIHDHVAIAANPHQKNKALWLLVDGGEDLHVIAASMSSNTTVGHARIGWNLSKDLQTTTNGRAADLFYLNYASPSQTHYRWYNDDGNLNSATAISAEDIAASGSEALVTDTNYRLRFQISNEGPASSTNDRWRLEMIKMGASCTVPAAGWSWRTVPAAATLASHSFDIEASAHFTDGASISANVLTASDPNFTNGYALDTRATTGYETINGNQYTEIEYSIKPNSNASIGSNYCFRLGRVKSDNSIASASYSTYAYAAVAAPPVATLAQNHYQWFRNDDSVQPGSSLRAGDNEAIVNPNQSSDPLRLRVNVQVTSNTLAQDSLSLKLQYSKSAAGPWNEVGGNTANGDPWCEISNDCTPSWRSRKKITLNNSASAENLTNFPILVTLSAASGSIDYSKTQDSGQDIRFVDAGGTASLSYEIENWNESGTSYVWVKVPQIDANSTTDYIWMYYNNTSASDGQIPTNVWNSEYRGVWHMKQNPGGVAPQMTDSTSRDNDGTSVGTMTSGDSVSAKVYNGTDFDGNDDGINSNAATNLDNLSKITVSGWIYPRTIDGNERRIADKGQWYFNVHGTNRIGFSADFSPTQTLISNGADNSVTLNRWQHVAFTWDGSATSANADIYVNGQEVSYAARFDGETTRISDAASDFFIGNRTDQALGFDGLMDEIRIASTSRSADWVEAEYKWSWEPWDYSTFGSEETLSTEDAEWGFYDNNAATDGAAISTNLLSGSDVLGRYAESNPTTATHSTVSNGQDIEFDFALDPSDADKDVDYYFRVIKSDGTGLSAYNNYPTIILKSPVTFVPPPELISGGGSMRQGGEHKVAGAAKVEDQSGGGQVRTKQVLDSADVGITTASPILYFIKLYRYKP